MRRIGYITLSILVLLTMLTACGKTDAQSVAKDLENKLKDLKSYKTLGVMKIQSGELVQEYKLEIWYKEPHYYRVVLNSNNVPTQVILRNDEGVFILTPQLNKSFRFKSEWPSDNSQPYPYLYQSLVNSVISDHESVFSAENKQYLFDVKANYNLNRTLTRQKVWFDNDLKPLKVEILDENQLKMIEVVFEQFEFDVKFDEDAFDTQRNMTGWQMENIPVFNTNKNFGIIEPSYLPQGVVLKNVEQISKDDKTQVILKYDGKYQFTIIEELSKDSIMTMAKEGNIIDLGFTQAVISGEELKQLAWSNEGIDYILTGNAPTEEMVMVAKSLYGQAAK